MTQKKRTKQVIAKTLSEVADAYDRKLETVNRWRASGMPGKSGCYVLRDVTRWLLAEGPWSKLDGPSPATSSDPLLAGGTDSPALERYRLAKAKHAELDLANRQGELIDVAKCKATLGRWAGLIRQMGVKLGKRYGTDASELVTETLDECRAAIGTLADDDTHSSEEN